MKILYYNWIQFDNKKNLGGGVNVYQKNLIEYLVNNSEHEIYFLSSGWKYDPLNTNTYIKETKNIYGDKCKTFEIINSTVIAPAFSIYMNPERFVKDMDSYEIFDKFIQLYGKFDAIHFNNIEGISVNVLKLKEKYPDTKFIVSIHNYQPICPLNQYFQGNNKRICSDFQQGCACSNCSETLPDNKEYYRRCREFYYDIFSGYKKILRFPFKILSKFCKYRTRLYTGTSSSMKADYYNLYRKHNVECLNKYADNILAVSNRVAQILIEHGVNSKKIITSYIGTKVAEQEVRVSSAAAVRPFTISYLGYERIDKGFFFFIDALSKLDAEFAKHINVVLAVSNIHKKNYLGKLDKFNNVIVYNGYSHDNLHDILKTVNLGVVPVLWEDNLPQVAIEMVANGVPILCSSFGGASELCSSPLFKFKGGDEIDFINKLKTIVNSPDLLQEYWSNHAGLTTMETHVQELLKIYNKQDINKFSEELVKC